MASQDDLVQLMINMHARSGDILQAEHWFHEMLQANIQPDETYNALIRTWLRRIIDSPVGPGVFAIV